MAVAEMAKKPEAKQPRSVLNVSEDFAYLCLQIRAFRRLDSMKELFEEPDIQEFFRHLLVEAADRAGIHRGDKKRQ